MYMRKALSLITLVLLATTSFAATTWVDQTSNLPSAATTGGLNDVFFIDDNIGLAVGSDETIVKTTDGGSNWTKRSVTGTGATFDCSAVYFPSSSVGYVVGSQNSDGVVLKSTDGGDFWSSALVLIDANLIRDVFFIDDNIGWICGDSAKPVFKTTNGGGSWVETTDGFSVADKNKIYYGIHFVSSQIGWVVGDSGVIYKTTDGGTNWSAQTSGTANQLNDVYFADASNGWAVGDSGTILKTTNGGTSWSSKTSGTANNLNSVSFPSATQGWTVGDSGVILASTDGGDTWTAQTSGTTADINGVNFADQFNGWVVGEGASSANVVEMAAIISIASVTRTHPTSGDVSWESQGALRQVKVTGENFNSGTTLSFPSTNISVYNATAANSSELNAMIWVPATESTGLISAKVANTDTASDTLANAFDIHAGGTGPIVTSYEVTNAQTGSSIVFTDAPQLTVDLQDTSQGITEGSVRFTVVIGNPPTHYWTFFPVGTGYFTALEQSGSLITKAQVQANWRKVTNLSTGATSWIQDVFTTGSRAAVYFYGEDADSIPTTLALYNNEVYCQFGAPQQAIANLLVSNLVSEAEPGVTIQAEVTEDIANEITTDGAVLLVNGGNGLMTNHNVIFRRVNPGATASGVRAAALDKTIVQVSTPDLNPFGSSHGPPAGIYVIFAKTARTNQVFAKGYVVSQPWR